MVNNVPMNYSFECLNLSPRKMTGLHRMNNVILFDTPSLYFQILFVTYSKEGQSDDEDDVDCSDSRFVHGFYCMCLFCFFNIKNIIGTWQLGRITYCLTPVCRAWWWGGVGWVGWEVQLAPCVFLKYCFYLETLQHLNPFSTFLGIL